MPNAKAFTDGKKNKRDEDDKEAAAGRLAALANAPLIARRDALLLTGGVTADPVVAGQIQQRDKLVQQRPEQTVARQQAIRDRLIQERPEQALARQKAIRDQLLAKRMVIDPELIEMEGLAPIDPNLIQMTDELYAGKVAARKKR